MNQKMGTWKIFTCKICLNDVYIIDTIPDDKICSACKKNIENEQKKIEKYKTWNQEVNKNRFK